MSYDPTVQVAEPHVVTIRICLSIGLQADSNHQAEQQIEVLVWLWLALQECFIRRLHFSSGSEFRMLLYYDP